MSDIRSELSAALGSLGKAVFSQPIDKTATPKVTLRPIRAKGKLVFQSEVFENNKALHRNYGEDSLLSFVERELAGRYRQVLIQTSEGAAQYVLKRDGSYKKTGKSAAVPRPGHAPSCHDRQKHYLLPEGEAIPALVDLGVLTPEGQVVKAKYDKFKQINRFVELIDDALSDKAPQTLTVLDFGCGKSYLTFVVYYYLTVKRSIDATIIGYDVKEDVVAHCNAIAEKYGYHKLRFVVADVSRDVLYEQDFDMLLTLHACDTATDYALAYAVQHKAKYIFSVPCCQHEINAKIQKGGDMDLLLKHGIVKERLSALLTDSIRAEVLEDMGYSVDMIEFIDFDQSPKNLMLRARKTHAKGHKRIEQCHKLCEQYGFSQTLLALLDTPNEG